MNPDLEKTASIPVFDGPVLELTSETESRTVQIEKDVTRLGRSQDNEVQVLDARVSKHHAEIRKQGKEFLLVDVGSKAGVLLNGATVRSCLLSDRDVITLGPMCSTGITFRVVQPKPKGGGPTSVLTSFSSAGGGQLDLHNLAKFMQFSRALSGRLSSEEVLQHVVDLGVEITKAERGLIITEGPDGQLEFQAVRGHGQRALPAEAVRVSETIVRQVLEEKSPRIVSDVCHDAELAIAQSVVSLELGSAVAIPLWRHVLTDSENRENSAEETDEVFGVLYLDSRTRRRAFDKFDIGLLETLARDASSAIENVRLLHEAEAKRRMEQELLRAQEVQNTLLPKSYWGGLRFEVSGSCIPCLDLGGDYLGQFRLADGHVGLVVADVCGKGLPAALLAAALQGALVAEFDSERSLGEIVERVNRAICQITADEIFISMMCCVLTPHGELRYVDAGHCPLLVVQENAVKSLVTNGIALGFDATASYEEQAFQLRKGDVALLYSDGVLEAMNSERDLFGEKRLEATASKLHGQSASDSVAKLLETLESFIGEAPVTDDSTILALSYH